MSDESRDPSRGRGHSRVKGQWADGSAVVPVAPPSVLNDTATLGGMTFACRYDRFSGNVYTFEPLAFVRGDVLELDDRRRRLLIVDMERRGGVTRVRTRPAAEGDV